jgi:hypothetical protein
MEESGTSSFRVLLSHMYGENVKSEKKTDIEVLIGSFVFRTV